MTRADAEGWFAYLRDPRVTLLTSYSVTDLSDIDTILRSYEDLRKTGTAARWAILNDLDGSLIGQTSFYLWDETNHLAELGFDLAPLYWNRNITTRAAALVIQWAFSRPAIHRVQAVVNTQNSGSLRVLSKLGFQIERTLPSYRICAGHPADYFMLGLTNDAFRDSQNRL
jgi:ribosomal-protein-alanine N-acetyltransferase